MDNDSIKNTTKIKVNLFLYMIGPIILDNIASEYYGKVSTTVDTYNKDGFIEIEFSGDNHEQHAASYEMAILPFKKKVKKE